MNFDEFGLFNPALDDAFNPLIDQALPGNAYQHMPMHMPHGCVNVAGHAHAPENSAKLTELQQDYEHLQRDHEALKALFKELESSSAHVQRENTRLQLEKRRLEGDLQTANRMVTETVDKMHQLQKQLDEIKRGHTRKPYQRKEKVNYERRIAQMKLEADRKDKVIEDLKAKVLCLQRRNRTPPRDLQDVLKDTGAAAGNNSTNTISGSLAAANADTASLAHHLKAFAKRVSETAAHHANAQFACTSKNQIDLEVAPPALAVPKDTRAKCKQRGDMEDEYVDAQSIEDTPTQESSAHVRHLRYVDNSQLNTRKYYQGIGHQAEANGNQRESYKNAHYDDSEDDDEDADEDDLLM